MKKNLSLKMLVAFSLIVFCIQGSALAQQDKIEALQTKVEKLQQKVSQLESKIAKLEKLFLSNKNKRSSSKRNITTEKWENKENWRKLEIGMLRSEVKQILGDPSRIDVRFGSEKWYYGFVLDYVKFSDKKVIGWSEPIFKNTHSDESGDNIKNTKSSFGLSLEGVNRVPLAQPLPSNITGQEAVITIRFEVKPDGTVGRIIPLKKIMNPQIKREVMHALRNWRFSRLPSDIPQQSQWGTITFHFVRE